MCEIRVLVNGSCYPTNIGNAFVDIGMIYSLKSALGEIGTILHVGRMSDFLFRKNGKLANTLSTEEIIDCDYVVMGGMIMCEDHLQSAAKTLRGFAERGVKIIIVGGGSGVYDNHEVKKVRELLKSIPLYGFVSRDEYTYEQYKNLASHSYNGIDNALFIGDCFQPIELNLPEYVVINFDSITEPYIDSGDHLVIRTHHSCYPEYCKPNFFSKPNTLISDLASDYLNLYARASIIYTDRIHAAIAGLAFGRWVRLYFKEGDKRIHMFQRIGVPDIYKLPVCLNSEQLIKDKSNQINFLRTILLERVNKGTYTKDAQLSDMPINVIKQQIPEYSIFLLVNEKKSYLYKAIDSILAQTCLYFNLFVVDFTTDNVAKIVVEYYEDPRVCYVVKQPNISLVSIFENIQSKYITCVSPDMVYEPYFLYELKKSLQEHPKVPLVYSDYQQIGPIGFKNIIVTKHETPEKNLVNNLKNLGFCFLARRESISGMSDAKVNIFNGSNFWIPLTTVGNIHHVPQVLGRVFCKPGSWAIALHFWRKLRDSIKNEGSRRTLIKIYKNLRSIYNSV